MMVFIGKEEHKHIAEPWKQTTKIIEQGEG